MIKSRESLLAAMSIAALAAPGAPGDTASVLTGENSGVCGCEFTLGSDDLIYAFPHMPDEDVVFTHSCSRTHESWAGDPDIAALNEITPVVPRTWGAVKLLYR